MIVKHGSKIGTATVISNTLLKAGAMIPNEKITVKYITAHNTGNWDVPANNYYRSLKRQNESKPDAGKSSYHFVVDDKEIYQIIDTNNKTWHAGDSTGNATSVGVEICMFKDKARHNKAKANAQALIVELLKGHKLGSDKVKKHQDWSGKYCPQTILDETNGWANFTKEIKNLYNGASTSPTTWKNGSYEGKKAKVTADVLNVRKGRGTNFAILGKLKKGEVVNLSYCLDKWVSIPYAGGTNGMGYIHTDYLEII